METRRVYLYILTNTNTTDWRYVDVNSTPISHYRPCMKYRCHLHTSAKNNFSFMNKCYPIWEKRMLWSMYSFFYHISECARFLLSAVALNKSALQLFTNNYIRFPLIRIFVIAFSVGWALNRIKFMVEAGAIVSFSLSWQTNLCVCSVNCDWHKELLKFTRPNNLSIDVEFYENEWIRQ